MYLLTDEDGMDEKTVENYAVIAVAIFSPVTFGLALTLLYFLTTPPEKITRRGTLIQLAQSVIATLINYLCAAIGYTYTVGKPTYVAAGIMLVSSAFGGVLLLGLLAYVSRNRESLARGIARRVLKKGDTGDAAGSGS